VDVFDRGDFWDYDGGKRGEGGKEGVIIFAWI